MHYWDPCTEAVCLFDRSAFLIEQAILSNPAIPIMAAAALARKLIRQRSGACSVPSRHSHVTAGKDKLVKYWDADKFEQLLELPGHQGAVWGLAVSHLGDLVVSCGGDRAIRR